MRKAIEKEDLRKKRHLRVRKQVSGTAGKPRLNVFRSLCNIYAQVIDDQAARTLCSASTLDAEIRESHKAGGNIAAAAAVGHLLAKRCLETGVDRVVFDRGGYLYHGRVKALADAAREEGLKF